LNTPTRPLEASGTSGEKAEMNGVLNFSVLDGWWYEGYREGAGWALTSKRTYDNQEFQDQLDTTTIYSMLENEIIPLYYAKNSKGYSPEWIQYIKNSFAQIAPFYTTKRMFDDYINRFYTKLANRSGELQKKSFAKARELAAWKENVASNWDSIEVIDFDYDAKLNSKKIEVGDSATISLALDKHEIKGDLGAELVRYHTDSQTGLDAVKVFPMQIVKAEGSKAYYVLQLTATEAGTFKFGLRIYPDNKDLPHRMDFAYVKWLTK